jgi:hypothetical protein
MQILSPAGRVAAVYVLILVALAVALLGCDSDPAPLAGSCQANVEILLGTPGYEHGCHIPMGLVGGEPPNAEVTARCAAILLDLEPPHETLVTGAAYEVAYAALCELHGDTAASFCEISSSLGCKGGAQ